MNIYFLIAGVENKYFLGKSERPWAHELMSQTGGEFMSWSPSVSAALVLNYNHPNNSLIVLVLPAPYLAAILESGNILFTSLLNSSDAEKEML